MAPPCDLHSSVLGIALGALALLATGCGGAGLEAPAVPEVPPLPALVEGFDPRVEELVRSSHAALVEDPLDPERWMQLGRAYEAHSESALAVPCYEHALELRPDQARWWYRLALARGGCDRIEEGLVALERSIALDASHGPSHWRRGLWLLELDRPDDARAAFERSLELDPQDPAGLLGRVQVHLHVREYEQAAALLDGHALLRSANGGFARKLLGTAYQRLGREAEARLLLASAKDAKPHYVDYWNAELDGLQRGMAAINRQARALIASGQAIGALGMLEAARLEEPRHVPTLRTLGAAYAAVGRTKDAFDILTVAADLEPENVELRVDATWAQAMFGDLEGALAEVLAILAREPTSNKAHVLHAQLLIDLGRGAEAVTAFDEAMARGAREPRMLVDIGKLQLQLGAPQDARRRFELAAQQDPLQQGAWIGRAIACIELRDLSCAEEALGRAEELSALQAGGADPVLADVRAQVARLRDGAPGEPSDGGR
jgi:superkiller protein 3